MLGSQVILPVERRELVLSNPSHRADCKPWRPLSHRYFWPQELVGQGSPS